MALTLAALLAATAAHGQPLTGPDGPGGKSRSDADGALLPDGAITRLGSARFRYSAGPIGPIVFSPDGKVLAVASRSVLLFDVATGRLLHDLQLLDGYHSPVVRFLADGNRVAVGYRNYPRTARLTFFTVDDGKPAASPDLTGQRATDVIDVTPDGSRALLLEWGKQGYLWDLKAGRELWSFEHTRGSQVLPLTPDGKWFAVTGIPQAELRNADSGKVAAKFPDPGRPFDVWHGVGLSPDGRVTVAARTGEDAVAVLTARGPTAGVRTLPADRDAGRCLFSPDSRYLVGAGPFGTQVWDLAAADDKGPVARLPAADNTGFSPDGKNLALAGEGFVALWSVGDWKVLPQSAAPPASVHRLHVTDDGRWVFGYTQEGWVRWPAAGGPADRPFAGDATGIRMHAEVALAVVSADGRVAAELIRPPRGKGRRLAFAVADAGGQKPRLMLDWVYLAPYLSPDGGHVASVDGPEARVWDARTGEVLFRHKYREDEWLMAALPALDGRGLAQSVVATRPAKAAHEAPQYTAVTVTDHATGRTARLDPVPWLLYDGARFSRDGTRLLTRGRFDAIFSKEDTVSVWDARTGRRLAAWTGDHNPRDAMDLSADNRSFLVGDHVGRLTLVEVATGGERARFQHRGIVSSAAFFPDETKAVSSTPDGPVYVWDLIGDPGKWDAGKADDVWADLASTDAKAAFAAIRKLRANPADAVAFLNERVKTPSAPADERVAQWLKDLDASRFAVREQAQRELTAAADPIRPRLEAARKGATAEASRRLDEILKAADGWTPETLRQARACEVLEGIRTSAAIRVLETWAVASPGTRLAVEAKESVERLRP